MKVVGLITEYNPFHNGHKYHLEEAKRVTGADYVIVVMSGDFVQRGTPALIDKYMRTTMALSSGADIVFELPVCYSTASAELFALGAVSLLDKLGIVDSLCFGSELGDIEQLKVLAKVLLDEPEEYKVLLNQSIKMGKTFPAARMESIKELLPDSFTAALLSPNNILGIEYLKALMHLNSKITPVTIQRKISGYHDSMLSKTSTDNISSATAIRRSLISESSPKTIKGHVPDSVYQIMNDNYNKIYPIYEDDLSLLLNYKVMQETVKTLTNYTDITIDLANRIRKILPAHLSFSEIALEIKSKQWTLTRVNRALIHIILNLYHDKLMQYNCNGYTQYARILGFKKESSHLLRLITKDERLPVITKMGDAYKYLSGLALDMLNEDIFASNLYQNIAFHKYGTVQKDEYTRGVIRF